MARILIVDDDDMIRLVVQSILERQGHSVVLAECGHDGAEAISKALSTPRADSTVQSSRMPGARSATLTLRAGTQSLVTFLASVNTTGTTSMEVGIKVMTENIQTQTVRHANSCFFTMVAMDDQRKAVAVPALVPVTESQRRREACDPGALNQRARHLAQAAHSHALGSACAPSVGSCTKRVEQ